MKLWLSLRDQGRVMWRDAELNTSNIHEKPTKETIGKEGFSMEGWKMWKRTYTGSEHELAHQRAAEAEHLQNVRKVNGCVTCYKWPLVSYSSFLMYHFTYAATTLGWCWTDCMQVPRQVSIPSLHCYAHHCEGAGARLCGYFWWRHLHLQF